jgi:creatinine amidohydrolase
MSLYFGEKSWAELEEAVRKDTLIIIPVGTTEEHGRHLPVETDAMIARMFGDGLGNALRGKIPVLVAQTINFGYSMDIVCRWPGCVKIRTRVFMDYMFDVVDSFMNMGFTKIAVLDCHGNHDGLLRTIMREIADKHGRFICTLSPYKLSMEVYRKIKKDPMGDIHGGEWETSMILAYRPELVNKDEYTDVDAIKCKGELLGPVSTWGLQDTKTGLFGDPTEASAELGRACLKAAVDEGAKILTAFYELKKDKL